jgi:hypothetical protein
MEKIEVTISNPEHKETIFEYLTRIQKNIPTYTQENFLLVLNQLSYITDSYRKTFLFDNEVDVLRKQNESLQSKLDEQIKVNEKLIEALKMYASPLNWHEKMVWQRPEDTDYEGGFDGERLVQQTLNENRRKKNDRIYNCKN